MTEAASIPAAETAAGAFAHVDPQTLFIGDNVRDIADLDEDFIDSIRQHGVLVPVTVVADDDGTRSSETGSVELLPPGKPS